MSKLFEDHLNRANQMLVVMAAMPYTESLPIKEQAEIVYRYEVMRAMLEAAKPYCINNARRLAFAYVNHQAFSNFAQMDTLLDLALLEQQGASISTDKFWASMNF